MDEQEWGLARFQKLRIVSFWVISIGLGLFILFARSSWDLVRPFGLEIEEFIEMAGLALIGIAILGRVWCILYVGGRKAAELIRVGPYSISRNPLYFFSIVGAAGIGAQSGSLVIAVLAGLFTTLILYAAILREEAFLAERFDAEFAGYRNSVPRLLPRLSLLRDPATITVAPRFVYRTLADGMFFFLAFPLFELLEQVQQAGYVPVLFRLY